MRTRSMLLSVISAGLFLTLPGVPSFAQQKEMMAVTVKEKGKKVTHRIMRWETATMITDAKGAKETQGDARYPVIDQSLFRPVGNLQTCNEVCREACGPTVCYPVCVWKCYGSPGDPRKP